MGEGLVVAFNFTIQTHNNHCILNVSIFIAHKCDNNNNNNNNKDL